MKTGGGGSGPNRVGGWTGRYLFGGRGSPVPPCPRSKRPACPRSSPGCTTAELRLPLRSNERDGGAESPARRGPIGGHLTNLSYTLVTVDERLTGSRGPPRRPGAIRVGGGASCTPRASCSAAASRSRSRLGPGRCRRSTAAAPTADGGRLYSRRGLFGLAAAGELVLTITARLGRLTGHEHPPPTPRPLELPVPPMFPGGRPAEFPELHAPTRPCGSAASTSGPGHGRCTPRPTAVSRPRRGRLDPPPHDSDGSP